ncbi:MAG: hypothetical protein P8018_00825 [Acidobacteriota bacterium]
MTDGSELTQRRIFRLWVPLAATWLMMSVEGPFLAAVIARLAEPKINLAAYGVAFAFALLLESPIILIMSASTALVEDAVSLRKLRNFTYALNTIITVLMVICLIPALFYPAAEGVVGLPRNVAVLTHHAAILLVPWPAAIGYRRFHQGILIRNRLTRRVAYGTVWRLAAMGSTSLLLALLTPLHGALVGAAALSAGVTSEAVVIGWMARSSVRRLTLTQPSQESLHAPLTYRAVWEFYYPLAITSMLTMGVNPLVTLFMAHSRLPIASLAVLPVINALVFAFRSMGLAFQDVAIALIGPKREGYQPLKRYAMVLGVCVVLGLAAIAFTPLLGVWFHDISGLSEALTHVARVPVAVLTFMPGFSVLLAFQHAMLVSARVTRPITWATLIEVTGILLGLFAGIQGLDLVGATAAASALMLGRIGAVIYLFPPMLRTRATDSGGSRAAAINSP